MLRLQLARAGVRFPLVAVKVQPSAVRMTDIVGGVDGTVELLGLCSAPPSL